MVCELRRCAVAGRSVIFDASARDNRSRTEKSREILKRQSSASMLRMVPHGFVNRLPFGLYRRPRERVIFEHFVSQFRLQLAVAAPSRRVDLASAQRTLDCAFGLICMGAVGEPAFGGESGHVIENLVQ